MKTYYVSLEEGPNKYVWAVPITAQSPQEAAKRCVEHEIEDRGIKLKGEVFNCYVSETEDPSPNDDWRLIRIAVDVSFRFLE